MDAIEPVRHPHGAVRGEADVVADDRGIRRRTSATPSPSRSIPLKQSQRSRCSHHRRPGSRFPAGLPERRSWFHLPQSPHRVPGHLDVLAVGGRRDPVRRDPEVVADHRGVAGAEDVEPDRRVVCEDVEKPPLPILARSDPGPSRYPGSISTGAAVEPDPEPIGERFEFGAAQTSMPVLAPVIARPRDLHFIGVFDDQRQVRAGPGPSTRRRGGLHCRRGRIPLRCGPGAGSRQAFTDRDRAGESSAERPSSCEADLVLRLRRCWPLRSPPAGCIWPPPWRRVRRR